MGKIWISGGGGAGSGSDDCTASKQEVLKGYSAITSDSDDEAIQGSLELTADATDGQVLSGKTYYNTNPKSKRTGSMTNQGAVSIKLNVGEGYTVPSGFHNGGGRVEANGLASQTPGSATSAHILSGQTAWINGSKITGNIASMGGQTITPGSTQQTVSCSGKYMTGNITISGVSKYASITGTYNPSSSKNFTRRENAGTVYLPYIRITNLGFTPTGFTAFRYQEERDFSITASYNNILVQKRLSSSSDSCTQYALLFGDFSSSALDIPVWGTGTVYNVIVYGHY